MECLLWDPSIPCNHGDYSSKNRISLINRLWKPEQLMPDVFHSQTPDGMYVLVCFVHESLLLLLILGVKGLF